MNRDRRNRLRSVVLVCLLLVPGLALAEDRVSGSVVGEDGKPLFGAAIRLIPGDPALPALEATTNMKGRFIFGLIQPSEYRLVAFSEGRRITRIDANIEAPDGESLWSVHDDVAIGAEMPSFELTGASTVTYDLQFGEAAKDPGEFGTGVAASPIPPIVKLIQQGKTREAIREIPKHLEKDPGSGTLNYLMAFAQLTEGELDGALASVERCIDGDGFEGARLLRGRIFVDRKRYDEALADFKTEASTATAIQVRRDSLMEQALLHQRMQNDAEAIGALEALIAIAPEDVDAHKELSALYMKTGDEEKSRRTIDRVAAMGGTDSALLYNLGAERYNAGDFEGATDYFRKVIALDAEFADAYFYLGFSRLGTKDKEGAAENLEKYLQLMPENAENVSKARELLKKLASS